MQTQHGENDVSNSSEPLLRGNYREALCEYVRDVAFALALAIETHTTQRLGPLNYFLHMQPQILWVVLSPSR